ncbi:MFS transporter [Endozoicomonas arenosclerae]|uniref:MFS transporter n=1 Tax=Endozoicomonas arenosclerae TaxID=1633495 RepID=UPI000785C8A2|nr:MFS transporter [Endozoicomonas arenosclerae]
MPRETLWKTFFMAIMLAGVGSMYLVYATQFVGSMVSDWGMTEQQAGYTTFTQSIGSLIGVVVFMVMIDRIKLREWLVTCLILVGLCEILTGLIHHPDFVVAIRLLAGFPAGVLFAAGIAMIGRLSDADRWFGLSMVTAYLFAVIVLITWPYITDLIGLSGIFILAGIWAFFILVWKSWIPVQMNDLGRDDTDYSDQALSDLYKGNSLLVLLSYTLFYAGAVAIWNFSSVIGLSLGMDDKDASMLLGASMIPGFLAALLATVMSVRPGYTLCMMVGVGGAAISALMMFSLSSSNSYLFALSLFNFCFSFAIPYYQGLQARMDPGGRLLVAGLVAMSLGMVVGSGSASALVNDLAEASVGKFDSIYWFAFATFAFGLVLALAVIARLMGWQGKDSLAQETAA